ncbi:hypothetical protein ANANG_G00242250 [Anguilla anguilla]|uniref:Uncharacterized protein n=1 Tax=Anguilla anguilla TaxID=7936 RepID=A0A9D3RM11_ANGAN|nr:hypothetical protein ANANG_G00242250 [Anguilla anguilla]
MKRKGDITSFVHPKRRDQGDTAEVVTDDGAGEVENTKQDGGEEVEQGQEVDMLKEEEIHIQFREEETIESDSGGEERQPEFPQVMSSCSGPHDQKNTLI